MSFTILKGAASFPTAPRSVSPWPFLSFDGLDDEHEDQPDDLKEFDHDAPPVRGVALYRLSDLLGPLAGLQLVDKLGPIADLDNVLLLQQLGEP